MTLDQSFDFETESSGGGCGLCGIPSEIETWIDFRIGDETVSYCPECDVGCCAPSDAVAINVEPQSIQATVDWPGLQWSGPSDTGNEPAGVFPAGAYVATVTVSLPGLGAVSASLPITVTD